jgi:hypothetical protein
VSEWGLDAQARAALLIDRLTRRALSSGEADRYFNELHFIIVSGMRAVLGSEPAPFKIRFSIKPAESSYVLSARLETTDMAVARAFTVVRELIDREIGETRLFNWDGRISLPGCIRN